LKAERYTEIAVRYFVAQEHGEATRFADRAVEEIESVTVVSRVFDDTVRLLTISRNLARVGRFTDAVVVTRTIELPHLRARALVQIADLYARAGAIPAARSLLDEAVFAIEVRLDTYLLAEAYAEIGAAYGKLGDNTLAILNADYAFELAPEIDDPYQRSAVIETVVDVYLAVEDRDRAREALTLVEEPYIRASVMVDTATGLAQRGEIETARSILVSAEETAMRTTYLRDELYRSLAIAYLEAGYPERSLEVASEIEDSYALALALAQIGRVVLLPQSERGRAALAVVEDSVRRRL
jgi:tetratricopeptide (TPR) repeat protein